MDEIAYRDMIAVEERHWWFVARRQIINALLARLLLPPKARILEVGCGSGGNFAMLAKYGQLDAAEYDARSRAVALSRRVAHRVVGCELPHHFPFDDERFDLIVMLDVLEHIEDDAGAVAAMAGHLTDTGIALITVPAFQFLWSDHDERRHHFRRYRGDALNQIFSDAGLTPGYRTYFNTWLFPAAVAVRLVKAMHSPDRAGSDIATPAAPINMALRWIFATERFAMGWLRLPFGVSYLITGRPMARP